jgi:hypothetical protein
MAASLSIAFREVGPLPFSIVPMRFGVRPLLDGQPEKARPQGPRTRRPCRSFLAVSGFAFVSDCPKASVAAPVSCLMAGRSGLCVSKTRNNSAGSISTCRRTGCCASDGRKGDSRICLAGGKAGGDCRGAAAMVAASRRLDGGGERAGTAVGVAPSRVIDAGPLARCRRPLISPSPATPATGAGSPNSSSSRRLATLPPCALMAFAFSPPGRTLWIDTGAAALSPLRLSRPSGSGLSKLT